MEKSRANFWRGRSVKVSRRLTRVHATVRRQFADASTISKHLALDLLSQLWSSKWSIKDEHKLLSELGGAGAGGGGGGGPGGDAGNGNGTAAGTTGAGPGSTSNTAGYYEHGGFTGNAISTSAELYESLGTMTQAQTPHLYTPPIGGTIGESFFSLLLHKLSFSFPPENPHPLY